jgi:quercetin dioxygenase-like cupin family protein
LPDARCVDVEGKVLLLADDVSVSLLRFGARGTIHEHSADFDVDVVCVSGSGLVSVAGEESPLRAGERIRWPAGQMHRLWTDGSAMETLMVEHVAGAAARDRIAVAEASAP